MKGNALSGSDDSDSDSKRKKSKKNKKSSKHSSASGVSIPIAQPIPQQKEYDLFGDPIQPKQPVPAVSAQPVVADDIFSKIAVFNAVICSRQLSHQMLFNSKIHINNKIHINSKILTLNRRIRSLNSLLQFNHCLLILNHRIQFNNQIPSVKLLLKVIFNL